MKRHIEHTQEGEKAKEQKIVDLGYFNRIGVDITKSIIQLIFERNYNERHKIPQVCKTFKEYYDNDEEYRIKQFIEKEWPFAISLLLLTLEPEQILDFYLENQKSHAYFAYEEETGAYQVLFRGSEFDTKIRTWEPNDYKFEGTEYLKKSAVMKKIRAITKIASKLRFKPDVPEMDENYVTPDEEFVLDYYKILNPASSRYTFSFDEFKPLIFPKYKEFMMQGLRYANGHFRIY